MIAVDSNVLLRYLLADDRLQSSLATRLMRGAERVLLLDVVLVEVLWTLKGKRYRLDNAAMAKVLHALFKEPNVCFENGQVVWCALRDFSRAKAIKVSGKTKAADFPDALIVNKSRYLARQLGVEMNGVYTFDRAAQELAGMKAP